MAQRNTIGPSDVCILVTSGSGPAESSREITQIGKYPATTQTMRVSWEKSTNPFFYALTYLDRGYLSIRKNILIPRPAIPSHSSFSIDVLPSIKARLYFPGSQEELRKANELIFVIPGGGFVTMSPENHDDYLSQWSRTCNTPIVALNYGKAPEFPFPWALEESFDAYRSVIDTNGESIGLEGWNIKDEAGNTVRRKDPIKIIMVGDSAYILC